MSNDIIAPPLEGYELCKVGRPQVRMQRRYRGKMQRITPVFLANVARRLHGRKRHPFKTPDGYVWMASITFSHMAYKFRALFPMTFDVVDRKDGTMSDRHIALYVRGQNVPQEIIDGASVKLEYEFNEEFERMFAHNWSSN